MHPHHREAIDKLTRRFESDQEPTAVYLAGSIAHGFEGPDSDIDLIIVVDDDVYAERAREHRLHFYDMEVWFKARVYAGGLDRKFLKELPPIGRLAQVRKRARDILDRCGYGPCGGTRTFFKELVAPMYKGTAEGNILEKDRDTLPPALQLVWDRAFMYSEETKALDRRIRRAYALETP